MKLQYKAANTVTSDGQISPHFNIVNGSTASVNMSELKIRYYFTKDAGGSVVFNCDWAAKGCGNISGALPTHVGKMMVNYWPGIGVDSWLGTFNYPGSPTYAVYDSIKYTPLN